MRQTIASAFILVYKKRFFKIKKKNRDKKNILGFMDWWEIWKICHQFIETSVRNDNSTLINTCHHCKCEQESQLTSTAFSSLLKQQKLNNVEFFGQGFSHSQSTVGHNPIEQKDVGSKPYDLKVINHVRDFSDNSQLRPTNGWPGEV